MDNFLNRNFKSKENKQIMNKQPLISVLVAVYNAEDYLDECIESIVNQTYTNLEIILVNDGSTDNSKSVCEKWAGKDNRIIVVNKPNGGLYTSRNTGLEKAKGELIGFVDCDDVIEPDMYETMFEDMVRVGADIVMCNSCNYMNGEILQSGYMGYSSFEIERENLVNRMLNYEKIFCSSVWSKLYKREIIGDTYFRSDIILGEDYYFNGMIYPKVSKFYYEEKPLYKYRITSGSMSRSGIGRGFEDKYKVAEAFEKEYSKYEYVSKKQIDTFKQAVTHEILYNAYLYKADKNIKKKWVKIFKENSKVYMSEDNCNLKERIKIYLLKYVPALYVVVTNKIANVKKESQ